MRIVLDTNVLVSSLWGGAPARVMEAVRRGRAKLLVSGPILDEYISVIARFEPAEEDRDMFEALFADPGRAELVAPAHRIRAVREDPSDDKFLECAVAGRADALVSGDKHLLRLDPFRGIPVLTPRRFLEKLGRP